MAIYGPKVFHSVGTASNPMKANGAHNFQRNYYRHTGASGDVRAHYEDLDFTSTGSGEVLRVRGIANGTAVATGGTVNAIHATGRVAAGKTVSGALNAFRATLEVAGTSPTPGGTLAALQLDSNIVAGATLSGVDSFVRVTNSGATELKNIMNLPAPGAKDSGKMFVIRNADAAATHALQTVDELGNKYYFMLTTTAPTS